MLSPLPLKVDLYSDAVTLPTEEMRRFMCAAEVGDEQKGEDPSVNDLQEMVAALLGKDTAIYLPSGTMCNTISYAVHCDPGDEILMDEIAHPLHYEAGAATALTGAVVRPIRGQRGIFSAQQLAAAIRPITRFAPRSRVVSIEQTTNLGGGACWSLEEIKSVCSVAREHGLATHLDGARLMNAVVATGIPAHVYAAPFDSVWLDLSKGLGAPVGAVLAGSFDFIRHAWRFKQRFGGAMRQAGIIAAAGIFALRHHVDRLAEDHAHAQLLARGLVRVAGIAIDEDAVQTNIVMFDVAGTGLTAQQFVDRIREANGVRFSLVPALGPTTIRGVTHLGISRQDVDYTLHSVQELVRDVSTR